MVNRECKRERVIRRIRVWAYLVASLVALAWPFALDFVSRWRLRPWFQTGSGTAAQQAEALFAMFTGGTFVKYTYSLALDWPFHAACLVFAARAIWLLRRDRYGPGHCRRCGYNLTGLPEPRCPECGERFEAMDEAP